MRGRSPQNTLHEPQIVALVHAHSAPQEQGCDVAGIGPNPARGSAIRGVLGLPLHLAHVGRQVRGADPVRAQNLRNEGGVGQLLGSGVFVMESSPGRHRVLRPAARGCARRDAGGDGLMRGAGAGCDVRAGGGAEEDVHSSIIGDDRVQAVMGC